MAQFQDFQKYMHGTNSYGMKSGIVLIDPPQEWSALWFLGLLACRANFHIGRTNARPSMRWSRPSKSRTPSPKNSMAIKVTGHNETWRNRGHTIFRNGRLCARKATISLPPSVENADSTRRSLPDRQLRSRRARRSPCLTVKSVSRVGHECDQSKEALRLR